MGAKGSFCQNMSFKFKSFVVFFKIIIIIIIIIVVVIIIIPLLLLYSSFLFLLFLLVANKSPLRRHEGDGGAALQSRVRESILVQAEEISNET